MNHDCYDKLPIQSTVYFSLSEKSMCIFCANYAKYHQEVLSEISPILMNSKHKRTGRKNLGGLPDTKLIVYQNVCPSVADL